MTVIAYGRSEERIWWPNFDTLIATLIDDHEVKAVCDIGGGAHPLVPHDRVRAKGLQYTMLDISEVELAKAPNEYSKICRDIAASGFSVPHQFDLAVSRMLAEHVADGRMFHKNVYSLLSPGGLAVHLFPTLYALPFVVNKVVPGWLTDGVLKVLGPRDRYYWDKFPARYSWCKGPTPGMRRKFESVGYEVLEYRGFYGHEGYLVRILPLLLLHRLTTAHLLRHPNPYLTSYAWVVLRKPLSDSGAQAALVA